MKKDDIKGKFYEVKEVDDKLVFRIYGKKNNVLTTFKILSTIKSFGIKVIWLVAGFLSPFYCLIILLDALILFVLSFFVIVSIIIGTNIFVVMLLGFVLSFVYTFAIGCCFKLVNPELNRRKKK
ncbi:MAG: hypothetical protein COV35_00505 [Alphaproteobacteria bacterium CG11_big_fil_rev_8_21_14_0_20_39_49]|nr:MAG: hypothetical protein COV35_00505 [Alphaproteobacteria bacterium CG11_big_fil_rev_8_21_14_0_20_39_49]